MGFLRPNKAPVLLQLTDLSLDYGPCQALKNVQLTLDYAEIHAIVGEHGAGKSSLGMVISGMHKPKSGSISFKGKAYASFSLNTALKLGIEMVYQEVCLNEYFTVAENLFFTNKAVDRLFAWNHKQRLLQAAEALLSQYDVTIDPATPLKNLNLSDRALVDILKHISAQPAVLILDETLEKLSAPAFNKIINTLMTLKQKGMAILFITHRIDDIYNFADKVSIMKNGEILITDDVRHIDKIHLIRMAYTQIAEEPKIENLNKEFYQLLKYNEAILRNLPVNLIVTDHENHIKLVNDYCKQRFGLEPRSYLDAPLEHLLSSPHHDVAELIKQAFSFQEERIFYQTPITVNQIPTISNIKTFPIYDGAFLIGKIITLEDMTEYDRLQKQVMLSEKLASVGLLAAGVAHEINNPLEIIYTSLSYMKYRFRTPEFHKAIDTLHEQIADITNIVSNLRSFSDNTQGNLDELEMNDIIRNMLNLIKHNAKYKQIRIHAELADQDLLIRANKHEIRQVLLNLFKNSFEAMPAGGEIFIKTAPVTENGARFVQILFKDTGPGISDANPNNIFLPFYSTKKGIEDNLGLGLSISYGIIKRYNGMISVQNTEKAGCQFVIRLPQAT